MAVHIKIKTVPRMNKDGSLSKTKKCYQTWVRHRNKGWKKIYEGDTKTGAMGAEVVYREKCADRHEMRNPNDQHYKNKHRIS